MSIGAELGQYILQTLNSKVIIVKIQWGFEPPYLPPTGTPVTMVIWMESDKDM